MEETDMFIVLSVMYVFFCYGLVYLSVTALMSYVRPKLGSGGNGVAVAANSIAYKTTIVRPDGRCLFRALVHGACSSSGWVVPDDCREGELADDLRARVLDELSRRQDEFDQWDLGDFDEYVKRMQNPTEWGGEPELLMASHVLQTPICVFIVECKSGDLINISNYGQEYAEDNKPIKVLFRDYGHYDVLEILSDINWQKYGNQEFTEEIGYALAG
ncbi:hypothetical protein MKW94_003430 [Papaver nudicaule]|uniref:Ubiquitin thioesterase OTU n=1 Tax=Papaver nudicaule TaxID=74823 RepID=A0AA41S3Y4_PAPNU|nr:hypothetical protein [Papaver nudicaule]